MDMYIRNIMYAIKVLRPKVKVITVTEHSV